MGTEIPKEINSRFKFVVIAAKRAVQLQRGAKPKMQTSSTKWTRVAIREVERNLVPYKDAFVAETVPHPKGRKKSKEKDKD